MARTPGPVAVSLRGLTFRYPGAEAPALRELNLDIPAGFLVGVTGPVGSGKSALARSILGIHPIESELERVRTQLDALQRELEDMRQRDVELKCSMTRMDEELKLAAEVSIRQVAQTF